jgi:hypothetical protein
MATTGERPQARPLFRKLALSMAVVCFLLAAVFGLAPLGDRLLGVGICLFLGFMMLTIGLTGSWPPRPEREAIPGVTSRGPGSPGRPLTADQG